MSVGGQLPWGGFKESGFGKEGSKYGFEEYTQRKVVSTMLKSATPPPGPPPSLGGKK
jgi:acyl-CoA reductase-like NAD-dependent aldehyde dehydrogenase